MYRKKAPKLALGKMLGFPRMIAFKHKYTEQVSLTDSGGTVNYSWKCNSLHDPNHSGTGTRPLYYNTFVDVYDHYTVIGSKIKFTIVPAGTTVQVPYKIVTFINDDTNTTTPFDALAQQKGAQLKICQGGVNPDKLIMTRTWSAKKYFGAGVLANNSLQGSGGVDPTELSYFQISFRSLDGATTVSVWVYVEIEYVAVWKELKDISPS